MNDKVLIRLTLRNSKNMGGELIDDLRGSKVLKTDITVVSNIFKAGLSDTFCYSLLGGEGALSR